MQLLSEKGWHDAALVLGVQSAIAAADAFTIHHLGKQCSSERHEDVTDLVESARVDRSADAARHLKRVLVAKSDIEYSEGYPTPEEAARLYLHAERFAEFVERSFKPA